MDENRNFASLTPFFTYMNTSTKMCFISLVVSLTSVCSLFSDRVSISSGDLSGTWIVDRSAGSLSKSELDFLINSKLELAPDQTFRLDGVPGCWEDLAVDCGKELNSYEGTWNIDKDRNQNYSLLLNLNNQGNFRQIQIDNSGSPKILFFLGHIDLGKILVFKKEIKL